MVREVSNVLESRPEKYTHSTSTHNSLHRFVQSCSARIHVSLYISLSVVSELFATCR